MKQSLADRVREFRTHPSRNWSTADLAKKVGTSRQNIENLEAGSVLHPRSYIGALAQVMGTTIDDLVGEITATPLTAREQEGRYGGDAVRDSLQTLGRALAAVSPELRVAVSTNLAAWANEGGAAHYIEVLAVLLQPRLATKQRAGGASV